MDNDQKIFFGTKEDSNKRRQVESEDRTPHERFLFFLQLCHEINLFSNDRSHPNQSKNNFIIQ